MPSLSPYLQPRVFWYANEAFTFFASDLHPSFYICTTYLQGANLKSSFFSSKPLLARCLASLIKASLPIIASYLVENTRLKWIFSSQKVFSRRSDHVCITFQNICVL